MDTTVAAIARYRDLAVEIEDATEGIRPDWQRLPEPARTAAQARVDRWHELMAALYDPLHAALAAVRAGDTKAIEPLVTFLEADVYCHRSGYMKSHAIRALRRVPEIAEPHRSRLQRVVLHVIDGPDRREFRDYIRLAEKVDDEALRDQIRIRGQSESHIVARHARWMLDELSSSDFARR